jgi:hypothetical protein
MEKYPKTIWRKVKSESDPNQTCIICGKKIPKDNFLFIKEIQFSWFRGDDTKDTFCARCLPSKEKRLPENLRM